jgi:hypothetical protein
MRWMWRGRGAERTPGAGGGQGCFLAVAGHADAWILDLSRAACKTSKGVVQRCENNQMHPSLPPFAALADLA